MAFEIGTAVTVYEADGTTIGTGTVTEIDECAQSFTVRRDEVMLGEIDGFDLTTGRETIFTDGIQDDVKTLMFGRFCK